jgi:predicted ATP-binding protein involved in virulence
VIVKRLVLTNFKNAKDVSLEFDSKVNLIIGINGSGKSTILDGLAIGLSWFAKRLGSPNSSGLSIDENRITNRESFSSIRVYVEEDSREYDWMIVKNRRGAHSSSRKSELKALGDLVANFELLNSSNKGLPLIVYYPVNRAVLDVPLRIRKRHAFDRLAAYDKAFTSGADFRLFFEWFREREDYENEQIASVVKDTSVSPAQRTLYKDPQLESVRRAFKIFLPYVTGVSVKRQPLRMEIIKHGQSYSVNQLSDGEKCLLALVGDIARRLAIANPEVTNPLDCNGVILIDEIDLHLHPNWQQTVHTRLSEAFPNCQFVLSTHSPHVINSLKQGQVFRVEDSDGGGMKCIQVRSFYGESLEVVSRDAQKLNRLLPEDLQDLLDKYYIMISKREFEGALKLLDEMQKEFPESNEVRKASLFLKRP